MLKETIGFVDLILRNAIKVTYVELIAFVGEGKIFLLWQSMAKLPFVPMEVQLHSLPWFGKCFSGKKFSKKNREMLEQAPLLLSE